MKNRHHQEKFAKGCSRCQAGKAHSAGKRPCGLPRSGKNLISLYPSRAHRARQFTHCPTALLRLLGMVRESLPLFLPKVIPNSSSSSACRLRNRNTDPYSLSIGHADQTSRRKRLPFLRSQWMPQVLVLSCPYTNCPLG